MKIIHCYLAKTILSSIALVTLVLIGLQLFILSVDQIDSIGKGNYDFWQAMLYVLLQAPYQTYLFFPIACLLGMLIGLGVLADKSELVVMRASGMSIAQVFVVVLKVSLVLIVVMTLLGETVIPKLNYYAQARKLSATTEGRALRTSDGFWLREGPRFIHIPRVSAEGSLQELTEYDVDDDLQLQSMRYVGYASYANQQWQLHHVLQTSIGEEAITASEQAQGVWETTLVPDIMAIMSIQPEEMNLLQLHRYIASQQQRRLQTGPYLLDFWKRLIQPVSSAVMMLLAIPFIFGPLRSSSMGAKLLAGAMLGFSFYMLNNFFGPISLVFQFPPFVAAALPTLLFILLGLYLLRRAK